MDPLLTEPLAPFIPQGLDAHPTHQPPPSRVCPSAATGGAGPGRRSGRCRSRWDGEGGSSRLTCLVTPGNGCSSKGLDILILLQKTLQKPGSFLDRNSKASSKALLPCKSRNSQGHRQGLTHPGAPRARAPRRAPPRTGVSQQAGSRKTW